MLHISAESLFYVSLMLSKKPPKTNKQTKTKQKKKKNKAKQNKTKQKTNKQTNKKITLVITNDSEKNIVWLSSYKL